MLLPVLRRFGLLVAWTLAASVLVFGFLQILPGDPARVALGVNADEAAVAQLRAEFGLDRPLVVQYLSWLRGLVSGDLGISYISKAEILPQLTDRLTVTGWLVAAGMTVAVLIAIPMGALMAVHQHRALGVVLSALSQVGVAIPAFLAGIALVTVFAVQLRWLPANGWTVPSADPVAFGKSLLLPALSLGLVQGSVLSRYVRSAILDVLSEDYLRTARSKGLMPGRAMIRHGLRNAAVPVVTVLGLQLSTLLVGAVVIERVFVIPGLGSLLLDAVGVRDLLIVQDVVMVLVAVVLMLTFVVDVLYLVIDPRMRVRTR